MIRLDHEIFIRLLWQFRVSCTCLVNVEVRYFLSFFHKRGYIFPVHRSQRAEYPICHTWLVKGEMLHYQSCLRLWFVLYREHVHCYKVCIITVLFNRHLSGASNFNAVAKCQIRNFM